MACIMTRISVGDFEAWKPAFDQDQPGTREHATGYRVFRNVDDRNEVFIQVEFETTEQALAARARLVASGVLDRFTDRSGPTVVEEAESFSR